METSDPTNDTQCEFILLNTLWWESFVNYVHIFSKTLYPCSFNLVFIYFVGPEEGEGGRESDVEVLGVSEGGGEGSGEPVGRSPGKCLSLRRRRSMSAGEATPNKRPKQNEEAPSTSQKKKANTPATNGDGKREGNRIEERRLEDKGEGEGSLEVVGESNGGNDNHDNNMDTAVQPPPPPPRTTGFILGLIEERDDGDKFNDSSQFVMPPITGLMNESELSPLEIPLASNLQQN